MFSNLNHGLYSVHVGVGRFFTTDRYDEVGRSSKAGRGRKLLRYPPKEIAGPKFAALLRLT